MDQTKIICIGCPKGCPITVTYEDKTITNIEGFGCKNGENYARNEFTAPVRVFTSTVKVENGEFALVPVKTAGSVPKKMLMECAKESCRITVKAPVSVGDVVCEDFCGTGVRLVATRDVLCHVNR